MSPHFGRALRLAADACLADPLGPPLIPNWNRVEAALPDLFAEFRAAAEKDDA